ncbi:MAG: carboxypeptidase-like regulatory domain-containing protein, partial [Flavobacteriaceae bacterium]|nr:carboxypeptidase-like regulatory domain-containing protein [Flavobacteriaceae bacterium]
MKKSNEYCIYQSKRYSKLSFRICLAFLFAFVPTVGTYANAKNPKDLKIISAIQKTISGAITDDDGMPLPGANIVEKGTSNGVQTDFDGNFTINVSDENAVLVVSFVGFLNQEIEVGNQKSVAVQLMSDAESLEEVVVTGYGSQRKSDVTGAISSIKTEDFNRGVVA